MSTRAGIVVTGTEVLSGRVTDRNGPWLSERLAERGIEVAHILVVGDRPADVLAALRFMAGEGLDLIVTSGGLGPTEDDLTAAVVGGFAGREMVLDSSLEGRIAEILRPLMARWEGLDPEAIMVSNRKQAVIPRGATVLEPVGTAPGLIVPPAEGREGPTVVVLPGPPGELQPMWDTAAETAAFRAAAGAAGDFESATVRMFGIPESEIAASLRDARAAGIDIDRMEITTCLRRGEIEVVTRYDRGQADLYRELAEHLRARHGDTIFSEDGSTVDEQVAALLDGPPQRTIAVGESCTGGLLAARLSAPAGASKRMLGGVVAYANSAKEEVVGVDPSVIERVGAVSVEVAEALADGAIERFGADVGVGITGVAGPDGGTPEKPVGTVCFSVALATGEHLTRRVHVPGDRRSVRDRSTTIAMHLVRRALRGDLEGSAVGEPAAEHRA
jgi:nicotinamide-nucleotide amidase